MPKAISGRARRRRAEGPELCRWAATNVSDRRDFFRPRIISYRFISSRYRLNSVSPYLYADLGVRFVFGPFWVGLSAGGAPLAQQWLGLLTVGFSAFGG